MVDLIPKVPVWIYLSVHFVISRDNGKCLIPLQVRDRTCFRPQNDAEGTRFQGGAIVFAAAAFWMQNMTETQNHVLNYNLRNGRDHDIIQTD